MLSAFTARPIVELRQRDKSKIESLLAYGDRILVGLNSGSLRIYRVLEVSDDAPVKNTANSEDNSSEPPPKPRPNELLREQERFSRHKIEQLAIIKEANILVSLSNGYVSLHDLQTYDLQQQLSKTRGAVAFAVTSNIERDEATDIPSIVSRLAVAVKRRLLLWTWRDMELSPENAEIALASSIKTLTWATGTKIVAGLSSSYVLVDVESQTISDIVGPGSIGGASGQEPSRLVGVASMGYIGMGGMAPKPLATQLNEGQMLLAKDINTLFIDTEGNSLQRRQIPWSTAPDAVGYSYPYLLALQVAAKGTLELRNPETLTLLQSIALQNAKMLHVPQPNVSLAHAGKGFLVASDRAIWRMEALDYDSQIDALVDKGIYDEAISLLGMLEDALVKDKQIRLREIKMLKAEVLFSQQKYRQSLDLFTKVAAPPGRVIKLYPKLIAGDLSTREETQRQQSESEQSPEVDGLAEASQAPATPVLSAVKAIKREEQDGTSDASSIRSKAESLNAEKPLEGKDLKKAVLELQAFLASTRTKLQRYLNYDGTLKDAPDSYQNGETVDLNIAYQELVGSDGVVTDEDRAHKFLETAKLVDTTLFRAYMYAIPSLAGSLFRIPNFCDPEVVNEKLQENGRYNDLIDFYFGKSLHRPALELLRQFGEAEEKDENAPQLHGPKRTVGYLQNLPPEKIDLILEFAEWPLQVDPDLGMEIFLADTENAETLPRDTVLTFLENMDLRLAVRYLEHVINELDDLTPDLHQRLITMYLEMLKRKVDSSAELPSSEKEQEEREHWKSKFLDLLEKGQYSPAKMLGLLPRDDPHFYEARAIVLSKMGQHKQALEIYVFKLEDPEKAEEYCNRIHLAETTTPSQVHLISVPRSGSIDPISETSSIYHTLLGLYLSPPHPYIPQINPALSLLSKHGSRLPASSTLNLIPETLPIKDLEFYFRGRIRSSNTIFNLARMEAGLRKSEVVKAQAALLLGDGLSPGSKGRNRRATIDEERVCGVCHKRLGGSVISIFPE
ncbi:MAG: Vacuolar morphogenesis protein 6 [Cirrosporium novae-zelandiae]|nr:MAG: Vacuolar morphogenesis protein 6 [Cirrosporium novae-zelandiae]